MIRSANVYLYFPGNTEDAFTFYRSVFGGDFSAVLRFGDFPDNPMRIPEPELDRIAHIALPLGEVIVLQGTDVVSSMPPLTVGNNVCITLEAESGAEAERLFEALADGGRVEDPLKPVEWAEKYGICADRFGVHWMVMYTGSVEFALGGAGA
jgi:PhnB protein